MLLELDFELNDYIYLHNEALLITRLKEGAGMVDFSARIFHKYQMTIIIPFIMQSIQFLSRTNLFVIRLHRSFVYIRS